MLAAEEAFAALRQMRKQTGANTVLFCPGAVQDTPYSETAAFSGPETSGDGELLAITRYAKDLGLRVFWKPTVNCRDGAWRTLIAAVRSVCSARPNDWHLQGAADEGGQARWYRDLFAAIAKHPWFGGTALWDWPIRPDPANHYTFRDAPALAIIREAYKARYQLTTTKEDNVRDIAVAPEYMDFLRRYDDDWVARRLRMGTSWQQSLEGKRRTYADSLQKLAGIDFVICNDHGFPLSPDSYGELVRRVGEKAGIPYLHPHKFRHTFVSIPLSNPEIGVANVAAVAGHAQPSTTLAIYTQVCQRRLDVIRRQMSEALCKKGQSTELMPSD